MASLAPRPNREATDHLGLQNPLFGRLVPHGPRQSDLCRRRSVISPRSRSGLTSIDQIVRTDMQELVDLDLHDHVYGYPPMGDDRHEMEGFRFWKTGYWKDALRGRPYHISALYVVDLKRFRQLATGVSDHFLP